MEGGGTTVEGPAEAVGKMTFIVALRTSDCGVLWILHLLGGQGAASLSEPEVHVHACSWGWEAVLGWPPFTLHLPPCASAVLEDPRQGCHLSKV